MVTVRGVIWQPPADTERPPTTGAIPVDAHVVGVGACGVLKIACFGTYSYHESCRKLKQLQAARRRRGVSALLQRPVLYRRHIIECRSETSFSRRCGSSSAGTVARRQNLGHHWITSWWKTPLRPNEPLRDNLEHISQGLRIMRLGRVEPGSRSVRVG